MATNGALIYLGVGDRIPGDTVRLVQPGTLEYRATLRSNVPVDHLELVWNGQVAARIGVDPDRRSADVRGKIAVKESGWLLLRAWNDGPDPAVMDIYPYATTSPVYVRLTDRPRRSSEAGTYFLRWLDRIQAATAKNSSYRTSDERASVLQDISRARVFYEQCASDR